MLEVGGYESLYPETYHVFFGALIGPALDHDPFHYAYYWGYGNRAITFGGRVDPELVALVGSRWLLVRDDSVPTVPGIIERFRGSGGVVYEVPDVLPRAFVAAGVRRVGAGRPAMVDGLRTSSLEELRGSVLVVDPVQAAALEARVGGSGAGDAGSAAIVAYAPDQVTIDVEASRSGVLVLTDVMAPGWVADVDGNRTPIAVVDSAFRGVPVDAGDHRVVFRYEPTFTYLGFALALASFVAILVLGGIVRWWDRRDAPATSGPL